MKKKRKITMRNKIKVRLLVRMKMEVKKEVYALVNSTNKTKCIMNKESKRNWKEKSID
jgi:hypothetical protein